MIRAEFEALRLGVSQTEIARQCGVKPPTISAVFRERTTPYPKLKAGIAAALGWTGDLEQLFEDVELTIKDGGNNGQ